MTQRLSVWLLCSLLCAGVGLARAEIYYIHNDHLGTPQVVTDQNQNVVWEGEYGPFGELIRETGSLEQPIRFPGQYSDPETGYYYNYYRDYDPTLGRYIQSDPIGLRGGLNTYAYVGGNPVNRIDPTGEIAFCLIPGVGWSVCGSAAAAAASATAKACTAVAATAWGLYQAAQAWGEFSERPPGSWPADAGSAEWGRRNGKGARDGKNKFHDSKQNSPWPGGAEDWSVNPDTGDIYDPNGDPYDNLNDM